MKKLIVSFAFVLIALTTDAITKSEKTTPFQSAQLTYPGSDISFDVSVQDKKLIIQPIGLSVSNDAFYHDITGYTVTNAEIGDLNLDSYPEEISENTKINNGYMGHDEMAIIESTFCQRFPIYKDGDSNAKPTGGMRQIQYKLVDGENCRILQIDKVLEF